MISRVYMAASLVLLLNFGAHSAETKSPESAKECIARLKSATECLTSQASYLYQVCKLQLEIARLNTERPPICIGLNPPHDLRDHYEATLRVFIKSPRASDLTKGYYAYWRTAMRSLTPANDETLLGYTSRISRIDQELQEKGERLQLEK